MFFALSMLSNAANCSHSLKQTSKTIKLSSIRNVNLAFHVLSAAHLAADVYLSGMLWSGKSMLRRQLMRVVFCKLLSH